MTLKPFLNKVAWYNQLRSTEARYWSHFLPSESDVLTDEELKYCAEHNTDIFNWTAEPLVEELQMCFGGGGIYHPLLHEPLYSEQQNSAYNVRLRAKKHLLYQNIQRAMESKDPDDWSGTFRAGFSFDSVLWLIEKPYRLSFLEIFASQMPSKYYWEILGDVWCNTENHWQNLETIPCLWYQTGHDPEGREPLLLTEDELKVWNNLPDGELTVYRGYCHQKSRRGWSWTFSPAKATWFAKRFAMTHDLKAKVVTGTVQRKDLLAFFDRRNEREVVINPKNVYKLKPLNG